MERFLIVTADDLGHDVERNRGILEAHRDGILTQASILANGPAFEDALARLAQAPELGVGLHLNLSEGKPLARRLRTLVGEDGLFLGKDRIRQILRKGLVDPGEIRRETEAQIEKLRARGIVVTHLDGHQHVHLYPVAREAIAGAAAARGVSTVRIPDEKVSSRDAVLADRRVRIGEYVKLSAAARPVYRRRGFSGATGFLGMALSGRMTVEGLEAALASARKEWTELMTHPGYPDIAAGEFSGFERENEMRVLTDPAVGARVRERFRLASYRDFLGARAP